MTSFPIKKPRSARGLEKGLYNDLIDSWKIHKRLIRKDAMIEREPWNNALGNTQEYRERAEVDVLSSLHDARANEIEFQVSQMSGRLEVASPLDALCLAWDEDSIPKFNPFLDTESRMSLRVKIVEWMMLCVLEDKLNRLCQTQDKHDL
jgi:hypothetical protein